jgi:hypothetical protein
MMASNPGGETAISGYDYGTKRSAKSPVSVEELRHLEQTVGWGADDAELLRKHGELFRGHAEEMVDAWRKVIGGQPHLAQWFYAPDGKPDEQYKAAVKRRFVQWVVDVATRPHDAAWLDYQEEIGLRHTPQKKNQTDGRQTPAMVPLRYLLGFVPMVLPLRRFFEVDLASEDELDALERAWGKAVQLHVTLWTRPYTREGLW